MNELRTRYDYIIADNVLSFVLIAVDYSRYIALCIIGKFLWFFLRFACQNIT